MPDIANGTDCPTASSVDEFTKLILLYTVQYRLELLTHRD